MTDDSNVKVLLGCLYEVYSTLNSPAITIPDSV